MEGGHPGSQMGTVLLTVEMVTSNTFGSVMTHLQHVAERTAWAAGVKLSLATWGNVHPVFITATLMTLVTRCLDTLVTMLAMTGRFSFIILYITIHLSTGK